MRNGYQPDTKQQEDAYLKNSNSIDPKQVKCGTTKFLQYGLGDFYEKWLSTQNQTRRRCISKKIQITLIQKKSNAVQVSFSSMDESEQKILNNL